MAAATATRSSVSPSPYREGVELRIRKHVPPTPFGAGYGPCPRRKVGVGPDATDVDRVAFAMDNPPLETEPAATEEHTFTITGSKTLRRFHVDGGGAHVVTGYFDRDKGVVCLAKIYDGVYYPLENQDSGWDSMTLADADYAIEAWAYETMQPVQGVGAKLVPEYYGTWTFTVADRPNRRRWVRMLLLQLVPGETVLAKILKATKNNSVQLSLLPDQDTRLRVLKDTFEAAISIWWEAEVLHGDLSPRNVMVRPDGSVVLIDFNQAVVYPFHYRSHPKHNKDARPLPHSPIERHWPFAPGTGTFADPGNQGNQWASWVPQSWLQNPELAAEWLLKTWGSPAPGKYAPLSDYFFNHPAHAERSRKLQAALEKLGREPAKK
ncbi:hypothetical protein N657DRAFT_323490 [Parathielavia appendiculata]|uniref:non-specific serine/threonine protein kinase n=1 Tax=Parathielavia appendiculata TaxID=2587402 RepID=A0AAN6Z004_9PEZI|nr:hypothetical protein N657DRAFT_323490 [Parathielavia appendiculata]